MIRAVLDPGVLIAALISPRGAPAQLLRKWLEGAFEVVASPKLLEELITVLVRPKFRRYLSEEEAQSYVDALSRLAIVVRDPADVPPVTDDPNDDYLFALGSAAGANVIVSGDAHLTKLVSPMPPVLTPRGFAERLR